MLLEFRDVWKSFGNGYVIRGITLTLDRGELVAIVGPNGSGKTTILRLASGLIAPSRGEVLVGGKDARRPAAKALLGYVPHYPPLYGDLTVRENLIYYAGLYGYADLSNVEPILGELGLDAFLDRRVAELSYGWRKRVDMVRALLHDPPLLLIDEPFSGLDDAGRRWLVDFLTRSVSAGKTVVMTSPRADVELEAKVYEIREGRLSAVTG